MLLGILVYILAAPVIAGALVIAVLSAGHVSTAWIVGGGLAGFVAAVPVAWYLARTLRQGGARHGANA